MDNNINKKLKIAAKKAATWKQTPWGNFSYNDAHNTMSKCPGINGDCDMCPFGFICPKSWL